MKLIILTIFLLQTIFLVSGQSGAWSIAVRNLTPMMTCTEGASDTLQNIAVGNTNAFDGYDIQVIQFIATQLKWDISKLTLKCMNQDDVYAATRNGTSLLGFGGVQINYTRMANASNDTRYPGGYDYSLPTFSSSLQVLVQSTTTQDPWSFFVSFDTSLWLMIILVTVVVGCLEWWFEGMGEGTEQKFQNWKDMMWQAFSGLFYTTEVRIQKFSSRIVFLCFWFMILVLSATYTADLTTKLSEVTPKSNWNSLSDVIAMKPLLGTFPEYVSTINKQGITNLKTYSGASALNNMLNDLLAGAIMGVVMDGTVVNYINSMYPCSTLILTDPIDDYSYGFLYGSQTSPSDDFKNSIALAIFSFKESPQETIYEKQYIYVTPIDDSCMQASTMITLNQLYGLWIIWACSIGIAAFIEVIDVGYRKYKDYSHRREVERRERGGDDNSPWIKGDKPGTRETDPLKKREKELTDGYLVVDDYIHIPSRNLHEKFESVIQEHIKALEDKMQKKFADIEKVVMEKLKKLSPPEIVKPPPEEYLDIFHAENGFGDENEGENENEVQPETLRDRDGSPIRPGDYELPENESPEQVNRSRQQENGYGNDGSYARGPDQDDQQQFEQVPQQEDNLTPPEDDDKDLVDHKKDDEGDGNGHHHHGDEWNPPDSLH